MEDRKRTIFAVVIGLIIVAALVYSFGFALFSPTPKVELPDTASDSEPGSSEPGQAGGVVVEVTPATVQSVIRSLSRYESYSRVIDVTYHWGDGQSSAFVVRVWSDGGWTRTDTVFPSGVIEHSVVGDLRLWLWYEDGHSDTPQAVFEGSAAEMKSDLMQRLPTYEDVLELDTDNILAAGYTDFAGHPCIYVETRRKSFDGVDRYWVSVDNGLLMGAEIGGEGTPSYRMVSQEVVSPMDTESGAFVLPDSTNLHQARLIVQ